MKTAHQLARELLAGPDLPIWHFDPSRAGMDDERDTSLAEPEVQENDAALDMTPEQLTELKDEHPEAYIGKFLTIVGDGELDDEPGDFAEKTIELLVAAGHVSKEKLEEAREVLRISAGH